MDKNIIIVSRHPATIQWLRGLPGLADAPVVASATVPDVAGKIVVGNIPLHLASEAAEVLAVEFEGTPPRGMEYTSADMIAAGVRLRRYRVTAC